MVIEAEELNHVGAVHGPGGAVEYGRAVKEPENYRTEIPVVERAVGNDVDRLTWFRQPGEKLLELFLLQRAEMKSAPRPPGELERVVKSVGALECELVVDPSEVCLFRLLEFGIDPVEVRHGARGHSRDGVGAKRGAARLRGDVGHDGLPAPDPGRD